MAKPEQKELYRVISRTEIMLPERVGAAGPILMITYEVPGHVPRVIWIPKAEWTKELEHNKILEEIKRMTGRTPEVVRG
jgi:hypothetical protein